VSGEILPPDGVTPIAGLPDPSGTANLDEALPGVSPEFAARLDGEDRADIAAGGISIEPVRAFEQAAIAREAGDLKEFFEERAGILEHNAGLPRAEAEREAARMTVTLARNSGYLWASLRAALAGYPGLLAQLPDRPGAVAVLKSGRVVRQGEFTGPHEVTP